MKFTIGENIRRARIQSGLTQEELSVRIGAKQPDISTYENGVTEPYASTLYKIARATNTDHYPLCWWFTRFNDNTE